MGLNHWSLKIWSNLLYMPIFFSCFWNKNPWQGWCSIVIGPYIVYKILVTFWQNRALGAKLMKFRTDIVHKMPIIFWYGTTCTIKWFHINSPPKWPHGITQGGQNSKWSKIAFQYVKLLASIQGLQKCFSLFNVTYGSQVMDFWRSKLKSEFVQ